MITDACLSSQGGKQGMKPFEFPESTTAQGFHDQQLLFSQAGRDYWKAQTGNSEYSGIFASLRFCVFVYVPLTLGLARQK